MSLMMREPDFPRAREAGEQGGGRLRAGAILLLGLLLLGLPGSLRAERVLEFKGAGAMALPLIGAFRFAESNDFALELWVKPATNLTARAAVFTGDEYGALTSDGSNGGWGLYWESGGFRVARKPSDSPATGQPSSPSHLGGSAGEIFRATAGVWHHVVVNFNRDVALTFFIDGVQVEKDESLPSRAYFRRTFDSGKPYRLGSDPGGGNPFSGAVDEVRFWNRVRTPQEIDNAFRQKSSLSGTEAGLLAYYRLNEPGGGAVSQGSLGGQATASLTGATRVEDGALALGPAPPAATDYLFAFNGTNQSIETDLPGSAIAGDEFTIEYWFKGQRLESAVRLQLNDRWVVSGWGQPPRNMVNVDGTNKELGLSVTSPGVQDGLWHHVALTWKRNTVRGFKSYYDGNGGGNDEKTPDVPFPVIDARVFLGSYLGNSEFLQGMLDEVAIWNRALSAEEIKAHYEKPARLFGFEPGLVAYYSFNDFDSVGPRNLVSGKNATFLNMSRADQQVQDTLNLTDPQPIRKPNPAGAGLWLGEVSLHRVSEVGSGSTNVTEAGGGFDFNLLLHADATGAVRLLKDVTIMQKRNSVTNLSEIVLLTDDTLIPQYDGVIKRGGKLVGQRYSSAFFNFAEAAIPLAGGLGFAHVVTGTNTMAVALGSHPFRHAYHPVHKDPRDLQGEPYELQRVVEIFFRDQKTMPGEGRDRLRGSYRETIYGLHKAPLVTAGDISLERISLVTKLNDR